MFTFAIIIFYSNLSLNLVCHFFFILFFCLLNLTDVERTKLLEAKIEGEKQGRAKGRAEGLAEGMEKGIEKGIEKNSIDIAKKMKLKGMSSDLIAEMTGLTINDIESL